MNTTGPLTDHYGRVHTDLRISVTDRCNIRCTYCMPAEGVQFRSHEEILSYEHIEGFVRVAAGLGIRKIRLTGGEPLVRRGVPALVELLAAIPGIGETALTTNGMLLAEYAGQLKAAGLDRLNISLDTLDPKKFEQIARRDGLADVLEGIAAARRAGFENIKLNALAIRGFTEDEIVPLALFAREYGFELRFIEFMPLDSDDNWNRDRVLPGEDILDLLARHIGPLEPAASNGSRAAATEYRFVDGGGRIGVVSSVSKPFCHNCNRLRLTSDGKLRNCLFAARQWDAREVLLRGGSDEELAELIRSAVAGKQPVRGRADGEFVRGDRPMHQIGG